MPFSMRYDHAKIETKLRRVWRRNETPPNPLQIDFVPTGTESLTGAPTEHFVDASPGAGKPLIASVAPPERRGSKSYKLTVTDSATGKGETIVIELHWDD